jgi:hypothetical protein
LKPFARTALAISRPMPLEQPVMSHVGMTKILAKEEGLAL